MIRFTLAIVLTAVLTWHLTMLLHEHDCGLDAMTSYERKQGWGG